MKNMALSVAALAVDGVEKTKIQSREQWLEARKEFVGASEISSLMGVHPYLTAAELFETKIGRHIPNFSEAVIDEDSIILPPTERGLLLESVAMVLAQRVKPLWRIEPNSVPGGYIFADKAHGLSSTPDAHIYAPDEAGPGALQIKSVADMIYRKEWFEGGVFTPPLAHAVQTSVDAALSGCTWGVLGVLVIGFGVELRLFRIQVRPELVAKARALAAEFWRRIEADERYPFDYARDAELISAIYSDDDGSMVTLDGDRAARLSEMVRLREACKSIEAHGTEAIKERKAIDAEIIALLGNGTGTVLDDGRVLTAKTTMRGAYSVEPTTFRTVRIAAERGAPKSRRVAASTSGVMPESF